MALVESKIRDYLADHLELIDSELTLLAREYHLLNPLGASGFIDILATDIERNYVIIEIKRSNQAARQMLHEVTKYASLLKLDRHVKDSEIRIIVISTHWDELLVPFSEFALNAGYFIEGYRLQVDDTFTVVSATPIKPVDAPLQRNISPHHMCYLYMEDASAEKAMEVVREAAIQVGIKDFVVLKISTDQDIPYPFGVYLSFQRYSLETYYRIITDSPDAESVFHEIDSGHVHEGEEQLLYLEDCILAYLQHKSQLHADGLEVSSPEAFEYNSTAWQVERILREGLFKSDLRLDDQAIIDELKGLRGGSVTWYQNWTTSKNKAKINEIEQRVSAILAPSDTWMKHIRAILTFAKNQKRDFRLAVSIYSPGSILMSLYGMAALSDPDKYTPEYIVQIDFSDELITFHGRIKWNGQSASFKHILDTYFEGNEVHFMLITSLVLDRDLDSEIMRLLGLSYMTDVYVAKSATIELYPDIEMQDGSWVTQSDTSEDQLYIEDFVKQERDFIRDLKTLTDTISNRKSVDDFPYQA